MTDERSIAALDVVERHANGHATEDELSVAGDAARAAVHDAAAYAAYAAYAARAAVYAARAARAARDAALAAYDAALSARDAVRDAAAYAAYAARVASVAAYATQKEMFIKLCEGRSPWQEEAK
jgi:hypothetical protein